MIKHQIKESYREKLYLVDNILLGWNFNLGDFIFHWSIEFLGQHQDFVIWHQYLVKRLDSDLLYHKKRKR